MDRVEIIVDSSSAFWRHFLGRLTLIWSHMRVRICFVITLVFYFIIAIAITEAPQNTNLLLFPAFVILGMWLTPIAGELLGSIINYKGGYKLIMRLDCNGVELEYILTHSQTKVFFNWENAEKEGWQNLRFVTENEITKREKRMDEELRQL